MTALDEYAVSGGDEVCCLGCVSAWVGYAGDSD